MDGFRLDPLLTKLNDTAGISAAMVSVRRPLKHFFISASIMVKTLGMTVRGR
jgi:hypothetical protein